MSTTTWTIAERVLTDDTLTVPDPGYTLKGGYVAAVTYNTFANPWADNEHVRRFRTTDAARRWIADHYRHDDDDYVDWDIVDMALDN